MRIRNRRETILGMYTLVVLLGMLHFIVFLNPNLGVSTFNSKMKTGLKAPFVQVHHYRKMTTFEQRILEVKKSENDTNNTKTGDTKPVHEDKTEEAKDLLIPPLRVSPYSYIPPKFDPLVYGYRKHKKGFLTIGIPSISRPNTEVIYLFETIQSIINSTNPDQRQEITVVIMLSDQNETYNEEMANELYDRFTSLCEDGFIQVIIPPEKIYPNFFKLKRTKHDSVQRVKWRAKQNIDFSYLFLYSANISRYYIQLEDDILCANNFASHIKYLINSLHSDWAMLEFCRLGFIGKMFKSEDLNKIAQLILSKFDTGPGDLMLGYILRLRGQKSPIYSNSSLFQHNGKFSSLLNKMMPSIDKHFKDFGKREPSIRHLPEGSHPSAAVVSSFEPVRGYPPSHVYDGNGTTFFWAKTPHKAGHLSLYFDAPQNISRIVISTGDPYVKKDPLMNANLLVGFNPFNGHGRTYTCDNLSTIAQFVDGELDTKAMGVRIPRDIACLRIQPFKNSKTWVMFREIVVIL
ncbi:hypothetical protein ACF0H5_015555 [Mactra antiquata]